MTTPNTTTAQPTIKNVCIVYTVSDRRGDKAVTVAQTGAYMCACDTFAVYGECKHVAAVKSNRQAQGRKF